MAKYTIELGTLKECGHNIFDFHYPFYDERKRPEFEEKFIKHFYFREICTIPVGRFKLLLEDKMNVVFPFYNELFKTALIEYDKLYNYDMTENYEKTIENSGKLSGISSTVGQLFGTHEETTDGNRVTDTEGNTNGTENTVEHETGNSTTDTTGTTDGTAKKTGTSQKDTNQNKKTKFLDTPQGLTDLENSNYITNLTDEKTNTGESTTYTDNTTESQETNSNSVTDTERDLTRDTTNIQDTTGKETTVDNTVVQGSDTQKSTNDNNTRTYTENEQIEKYSLSRKGNIGVQTGSDMLEKHIELQKKLSKIEQMFFDECEDLFMCVY